MEKNTAWAIGLSSVVLIGFFFLQTYLYPVKNEPTSNTANTEIVASNENTTELENKKENLSILEIDNSANLKEESYIIETEKVKVTFTNRGGDIIGYEIKNHEDSNTKKFIEMADNVSEKNRAFSISLGNANSSVLNDIFNVKKIDENTIGFYKNYIIKNSDGTNGEFTLSEAGTTSVDGCYAKCTTQTRCEKNTALCPGYSCAYNVTEKYYGVKYHSNPDKCVSSPDNPNEQYCSVKTSRCADKYYFDPLNDLVSGTCKLCRCFAFFL